MRKLRRGHISTLPPHRRAPMPRPLDDSWKEQLEDWEDDVNDAVPPEEASSERNFCHCGVRKVTQDEMDQYDIVVNAYASESHFDSMA